MTKKLKRFSCFLYEFHSKVATIQAYTHNQTKPVVQIQSTSYNNKSIPQNKWVQWRIPHPIMTIHPRDHVIIVPYLLKSSHTTASIRLESFSRSIATSNWIALSQLLSNGV